MTGKPDKELFPSFYPEADENRVSSTFWDDFTIADAFGVAAVQDTFNRAFRSWKSDYKYVTELAVVMNKKCWFWYGRRDDLGIIYHDLYFKVRDFASRYKGEAAEHYFKVTD